MFKTHSIKILLIICLAVSAPVCYGQNIQQQGKQTSAAKNANEEKAKEKQDKNNGDDEVANVERKNRRTQAIAVLNEVVNYADEIEDFESQANIISNALNLLWKHDKAYSRVAFLKAFDRLFIKYASQETTKEKRDEIADGIKILLKSFAKHDPKQAEKILERYGKLVEDTLNQSSKLSLSDRLSIAQSSLDFDKQQSIMIATKVLETGVSLAFTDYLYELEKIDEPSAIALYRVALSKLAGNNSYVPSHATYLSEYAFRERTSITIVVMGNNPNTGHKEFGAAVTNHSPSQKPFNIELAASYLNAAYIFLAAKSVWLEQQGELNAEYVLQCYFLTKKLNGYAAKLNLNRNRQWDGLSSRYELLAQRAGFTLANINGVARDAERVVNEGSIFQFDNGASAFEKAKNTKDKREKTELLVRGIHELLEAEKFAEAELKIKEIEDEKIAEQVTDYFHFRVSVTAIRKREWNEMSYHSNKITNAQLRMYLFLAGANVSLKNRKKDVALAYLQSATSTVEKIDNKYLVAESLVAISALLGSFDTAWSKQVLGDAIKAINRADGYDGSGYSIMIPLPKINLFYVLDDLDINYCFELAAKDDWINTINVTGDITRKQIRAMAQVAASRSVL